MVFFLIERKFGRNLLVDFFLLFLNRIDRMVIRFRRDGGIGGRYLVWFSWVRYSGCLGGGIWDTFV